MIQVERLGHRGDGIAAGPIYAARTLPGEVITGDIQGDRIDEPKIVTPSPDRVSAPCKHFKRCGGCALQHGSDAFLAAWKPSVLTDALSAHGLSAPIRDVVTSPAKSRRRATFSGRRTKSGALVGFHARGSDVLVDVPSCQLVLPQILATMPACEALTLLGASRKSEISLSVTWTDGGADVVVTAARDLDHALMIDAVSIAQRFDLARLTWGTETLVERVPPVVRFDGIGVLPVPGGFLQATEHGENALRKAIIETVSSAKSVVDLFAGSGTFALPISRDADVLAVEGDADMLRALDKAWRTTPNLHQVRTEARDLFRRPLLPGELRFDAAVIDPPRAGAEAQVAELAQSDVSIIAMVSCNPLSFARDAKILVDAGFSLNWIDVVDQFRWSTHIELVASFTR